MDFAFSPQTEALKQRSGAERAIEDDVPAG